MINRRYCVFNANILDGASFTTGDEYPKIKGTVLLTAPSKVNPFDRISEAHDQNTWLHFHVHDKRFRSVYGNPEKHLQRLKEYGGVFGIDHSIYRDTPLIEQKYSVYLNRATDYWFEKNGIPVICNVSWGDSRTFEFCCAGIPQGVSISVSSYGCTRSKLDKMYFLDGFHTILNILKPKNVFHHGRILHEAQAYADEIGIQLFHIPSRREEVFGKGDI